MDFSDHHKDQEGAIAALFRQTFTASEGAEEGALIGSLAQSLMADTPPEAVYVFTALEDGAITGAIIFSRLDYEGDDRSVFVLGPVAVATDRQGQGIGQRLIRHGLDRLRADGVDIAVTYGDPAYYARTGFSPVAEASVPAPYKLQHPEGWLAQPLQGIPLTGIRGKCRCVKAFDDPVYW